MAGFILFFPDRSDIATVERIPSECGLSDVLNGAAVTYGVVLQHGPGDKGGSIISVRPSHGDGLAADCQYKPDSQTWIRCVDKTTREPTHYLGFETANKPRPIDLVRPEIVAGSPVTLAGQEWTIPVILAGKSTLPRSFRMVEGELIAVVKSEYDSLCAEGERIFKSYAFKEGTQISYAELFDYVVRLLKVNYRVGRYETCALELIDTGNIMGIAEASFGFQIYKAEREAQKKSGTLTDG
jgi:hypothetical protein